MYYSYTAPKRGRHMPNMSGSWTDSTSQPAVHPRHKLERQSAKCTGPWACCPPHMLLRKHRLRWLGHVRQMEDDRIPKYILYGELASGKIYVGRPQLRYKDVCKRDLQVLDIDTNSWEDTSADRSRWRSMQLKAGEVSQTESTRMQRKPCNHPYLYQMWKRLQ